MKMGTENVIENFTAAMQRVRKDANCGAVRDWEVATDHEGYRHIFVQDPITREWVEMFNEGKELCHA
jgi:hypothetical protein